MSVACCLLSEECFLCAICLDVFNTPVTVPCGHNFCKNCIIQDWKINRKYQCPVCKKHFSPLPDLNVNTFVSEMTAQFRQAVEETASEQQKPREVPCDVCTGKKKKALKSCLVCMASYCGMHLEWHQKVSGLKRHKLTDPVENIQDRLCTEHDELMELFCKTEQMCICQLCAHTGHDSHQVVPMRQEYDERKQDLGKTEAEFQEKVQERERKVQEFAYSIKLSKEASDKWIAESVQVFTAFIQSVETGLTELTDTIKMKHATVTKEAEESIKELSQEVSQLRERIAEVKQLSESEDHFQFLQILPHLNLSVPTKDWMEVSLRQPAYERAVARAVAQLKETLTKETEQLLKNKQEQITHAIPGDQPLESKEEEWK
ncbi:E3 ubiquitin/ISG15 ligase TRIM25-like [Sphaeramia orbicularis]|nr:E3 ubiquitin/ISG15 ligase TRIM25-like [Sphaeramia orbicularis]